jgi:hypothetical protein
MDESLSSNSKENLAKQIVSGEINNVHPKPTIIKLNECAACQHVENKDQIKCTCNRASLSRSYWDSLPLDLA